MPLIDPKTIKNPAHRKLVEFYGSRLSSTPLKTMFHKIPLMEDESEALKPRYNLTKYIYDDLVYRYYFGSNNTWLIFGPRSDYKSTCALRLKLWNEEIAGLKPDYNDIIDSDIALLNRIKGRIPKPFTTFIKDEWDTVRSGLGNMTVSDTIRNVINRARYDRWNLVICTPVFKFYPVDYFLQVWEYTRYGKNRMVQCIIYNEKMDIKGHVFLPMPTDEEILEYEKRKKEFMQHMRNLSFNVDEELMLIAEDAIIDSNLPILKRSKDSRVVFMDYLSIKYPQLQSKVMKENIMLKIKYMQDNQLTKLPRPTDTITVKPTL